MSNIAPWLVLLVLIFVLWLRDEMKEAPTKKDDQFPLPQPEDGTRIADEIRDLPDRKPPPGVSLPDWDYAKDEEFCKKYPCDFMKPYRLPSGTLTYICTNSDLWERWGIKEEILRNLNENIKEVCARCAGLPCKGQRKGEKR